MDVPVPFPVQLRAFVDEAAWTFAKTMPEWPHEYIVRERVDEQLFVDLVHHIRAHGRSGNFYAKVLIYYEEAGLVYWTMGAPLAETTIVNRCRSEDTYERRLADGTLPQESKALSSSTSEATVFDFLCHVNRRPEPFSEYTARELWTDPHTAERMLAYHLDPGVDAASRNLEFIERSVAWIASRFGLRPGVAVADLGCGPGLYALRLARTGAHVTGVDFSASSLRYARETALREGLAVDYVEADYLTFETDRRFDLILMIMCDFCALSPDQRVDLLGRFRSLLTPGGSVLFDVYSPEMFRTRDETAVYAPDLLDGFWSPEPYFGFLNVFKYDDLRLLLDKYTIVERARTRQVFNWLQCFTTGEIEAELKAAGLTLVEVRGDVAGAGFDAARTEFAFVASPA